MFLLQLVLDMVSFSLRLPGLYTVGVCVAIYPRTGGSFADWQRNKGKDSFYPPSLFYRDYVFLMYFLITRLFSAMAFLLEMHNKRDTII